MRSAYTALCEQLATLSNEELVEESVEESIEPAICRLMRSMGTLCTPMKNLKN
jgi:hypothetical protein